MKRARIPIAAGKWMKWSIFLLVLGMGLEPADLIKATGLAPEDTVIISNQTDGDFCADFSASLRRVTVDWIYIKTPEIPDSVKDKNLIILGGPDALYTGDIVKDILTESEVDFIRGNEGYHTFVKDSPWADDRVVYICTGSDRIFTKTAAEETLQLIIEESENLKWLYAPVRWSFEQVQHYIASYQFTPDDEELSADELAIDFHPDTYGYTPVISSEDAEKDVERLFYLLSHGYCGYGYFKTKSSFEKAKSDILQELETSPVWSLYDFSALIRRHLQFIGDGHFVIGHNHYYQHKGFWRSLNIELWKIEGEYYFMSGNKKWRILEINQDTPEEFVFPSVNSSGEFIYILGILSQSSPGHLTLVAEDEHGIQCTYDIALSCSYIDPYVRTEERKFAEKEISGIPVVCIRSFSDYRRSEMEAFVSTAEKYRGEPYLILDIRGNGGGNSVWPRQWVEKFTGYNPGWYFTYAKFTSRTTLMGQINYWRDLLVYYPHNRTYKEYLREREEELRIFEESHSKPHWSEFTIHPVKLIPNDTKVIVLTDSDIMSGGELFIGYLRQMENVIFVGENSAGVGIFGWSTLHELPYSKVKVEFGCALYYPADLTFIEEKRFFPDLWVPASDVLDYVVAAIEKGII